MRSAIYEGVVQHRRHAEPRHVLRFRGTWLYLDLDEWERVFRGRWLWGADRRALVSVRRRDHLGGAAPLAEAVRERVAACTGRRPEGPVGLLTMPRFAGLGFNPVSFFYCGGADGVGLEAVVAEVTNTPWHERHVYVLADAARQERDARRPLRSGVPKEFHVSPFLPMDLEYRFRLRPPGERLALSMAVLRGGRPVLDARLALRRREIGGRTLAAALPRLAFQPARALGAIYAHALRLLLKGAPFHPHPTSTPRARASVSR